MKNIIKVITLISVIISIYSNGPIDITDYDYPTKNQTSDDDYIIPIFGTNDAHGYVFPVRYKTGVNDDYYLSGGLEYINSYLEILREDWENEVLWLDGGDQFQGGYEFMLSNGTIMNEFYNFAKLDAMTIGNHEFDFGEEYLKQNMNKSNFVYLAANLVNRTDKRVAQYPNLQGSKVFQVGKVKIGVIGLVTKQTLTTTGNPPKDLIFDDYVAHTIEQSKILREKENVSAVIVLAHFGPQCRSATNPNEKFKLKIRNIYSEQPEQCVENLEIMDYLKNLPKGTIDAVVGAHVHDVVHHWIHGIPVIETDGAYNANIMYLHFKKIDGKYVLQHDKTQIEGPLPLCDKIFADNKRCNFRDPTEIKKTNLSEYIFHGQLVTLNKNLTKKLDPFRNILNEKYKNIIVTNEENLANCERGKFECPLVNLVNDISIRVTGSDITFMNLGGLRTSWSKGKLSEVDIYLMFPFNNTYISYEMTGREVVKMMHEIVTGSSLIPSSGLTLLIKSTKYGSLRLAGLKFFDGSFEKQIIPDKIYTIGMSDFLASGGSKFSRVNKWYKVRNKKTYGIHRELLLSYLKEMKVIKQGIFMNKDRLHIRNITKLENSEVNL